MGLPCLLLLESASADSACVLSVRLFCYLRPGGSWRQAPLLPEQQFTCFFQFPSQSDSPLRLFAVPFIIAGLSLILYPSQFTVGSVLGANLSYRITKLNVLLAVMLVELDCGVRREKYKNRKRKCIRSFHLQPRTQFNTIGSMMMDGHSYSYIQLVRFA